MFDPIARAMGMLLHTIYNFLSFGNYGIAIILFTLIIKFALMPLTIHQQKSTAKMQEVQPLIQEIQRKYKNDKEKLNQEMAKVYQENKVNPAGGCLPILIQMPILFSLYWVISQPLKFMLGKTAEVISQLLQAVPEASRVVGATDISIINYFNNNKDQLANVSGLLNSSELLNMSFLGINLGIQPTYKYDPSMGLQFFGLLLVPLLAAATTYLSVKYSTPKQQNTGNNDMAASMNKNMTLMMPIMTGFFAFSVPAGLGLYWIVSNVFQIAQQYYLNKHVLKKKEDVK